MAETRDYKQGDKIFNEGDRGAEAYLVKSGMVEVVRERRSIATFGRGDVFGEMALIDDQPRMGSAFAMKDTEVVVIKRAELMARLEDTDPVVFRLLKTMTQRLRADAESRDEPKNES